MIRTASVVVVSSRAAAGVYEDATGTVIVDWLAERGFETAAPTVVADGPGLEEDLRGVLGAHPTLVITTGGTGLSPTDRTPEATRAILDIEFTGFGEEVRRQGMAHTPFALLSRGTAGVAGRTLIVNLPGSRGGVADGLALLDSILDHVLDQVTGGTHG